MNDIRFPEGIKFDDISPTYQVAISCERIAIISNTIYFYRCISESISRGSFKEKDYDLITEWGKCSALAIKDFPELKPIFFMQLHSAH